MSKIKKDARGSDRISLVALLRTARITSPFVICDRHYNSKVQREEHVCLRNRAVSVRKMPEIAVFADVDVFSACDLSA